MVKTAGSGECKDFCMHMDGGGGLMTQKTDEDNEDDARREEMVVKTETSPRTEAAPFSDRENL
jgi:hypothetical protein